MVRLERVSLVDASLTEDQVETIFQLILSQNPDQLPLIELDLREFDISSVSQEKEERVKRIAFLTLITGMSYSNHYSNMWDSPSSDSDSDSDSSLTDFIELYHIP